MAVEERNRCLTWLSLCMFAWLIPSTAMSQVERMELGRRVQRFEIAWQAGDAASRTRAVEPIAGAVRDFFSLDLRAAARGLDRGWHQVSGLSGPGGLADYCTPLACSCTPVLAEPENRSVALKLEPFYENDALLPDDSIIEAEIRNSSNERIVNRQWKLQELLGGVNWEDLTIDEGDYSVHLKARAANDSFEFPAMMISRIRKLQERIEGLEAARSDKSRMPNATARSTIRDFVSIVDSINKGQVQETDDPLLRRLRFCEQIVANGELGNIIADQESRNHDLWITLGQDRKSVPVRLRLPAQSTPAPVLFLFHGAGGSENMFFETYGAGRAIQLATERGWIVVSPRQGLAGISLDVKTMLGTLEEFVAVDRSRIMMVGHSMGAAQVMNQAALNPDVAIACVALGGGRRMKSAELVRPIKWFVAAGDQDFGRNGAKQLHESLEKGGVSSHYRDYANVEHLVIVQAALDDVFQFLDEVVSTVPAR